MQLGQVLREINVRRADGPHQFLQFYEAIEKEDMLLPAEVFRQPLQAQATSLALVAQQIRMRLLQHDVNDAWKFADNVGQRAPRVFANGYNPCQFRPAIFLDGIFVPWPWVKSLPKNL